MGSTGSQKPVDHSESIPNLNEFESYEMDLSSPSTHSSPPNREERPACQFRHGDLIGNTRWLANWGRAGLDTSCCAATLNFVAWWPSSFREVTG